MNSSGDIKLLQNKLIGPLIYLLLVLSSSPQLFAQQPKHFFKTDLSIRTGFGSANSVGIGNHLSNIGVTITDDTNIFNMRVEPVYGRFLSPHWLLGSGVILDINNSEFSNEVIAREWLTVYPFARYYLKPVSGEQKYQFFVEASYSRLFYFRESQSNRSGASAGLGLTRFLNNSIALDIRLLYFKDEFREWVGGRLQGDATLNVFLDNSSQNSTDFQMKMSAGSWILGVSDLFFSVAGEKRRQLRNVQIQSDILHFIADRLAVGIGWRLGLIRGNTFVNTPSESFVGKTNNISLGFRSQLRYYFSNQQRMMFFATTGVGMSYQVEVFDERIRQVLDPFGSREFFFIDAGLGLGANIFLRPNIAIELGPNIQFGLDQKRMRFGIDTGLVCFFGTK